MLHFDAAAMELRGAAPPEQATAPRTDSLEASAAESQVSNASQPSQPVASVSGDDAVLSEASAAKPGASSAAKPLAYAVFVWYNVGWLKTRFHKLGRHEKTLREDLLEAIEEKVLTWCCSASAAKSAKALDHSGRQSCAAAAAPAFG